MSSSSWRINPLSIISVGITLISVFLPWWGIYRLFGSSVIFLARWALWNPPGGSALRRLGQPEQIPATSISQTFTVSSLIVLVLALIVAALALAGGLTLVRKYLVSGLILSVLTPIAYTITIAYVTYNYCLISPLCATGPIGSATLLGTTLTWGFETGFYLFIVAIVVLALSLALNNTLARNTERTEITVPAGQAAR